MINLEIGYPTRERIIELCNKYPEHQILVFSYDSYHRFIESLNEFYLSKVPVNQINKVEVLTRFMGKNVFLSLHLQPHEYHIIKVANTPEESLQYMLSKQRN
jgi:hypothetical protein